MCHLGEVVGLSWHSRSWARGGGGGGRHLKLESCRPLLALDLLAPTEGWAVWEMT